MDQTKIDDKIQEAKKYEAEKYLTKAVMALKHNLKVDVKITDYE